MFDCCCVSECEIYSHVSGRAVLARVGTVGFDGLKGFIQVNRCSNTRERFHQIYKATKEQPSREIAEL